MGIRAFRYRSGFPLGLPPAYKMDVFQLTRALVDIESITGNEAPVAKFLESVLQELASRFDGTVERMEVEPNRFNLLASFGEPVVTFSTHLDTVPPFFPSREDDECIWGRGACDVKGIIAAMVHAPRRSGNGAAWTGPALRRG